MDAATTQTLVDLMIALERAGVQELISDGDRLRYRPRSALVPDLAERVKAHKADLLAVLRPAEAPDHRDLALVCDANTDPENRPEEAERRIQWEGCIDPPEPCPGCGGLMSWWNPLGEQRCLACDPPAAALRVLETVERIRRRLGTPSPTGTVETLADLKRLAGTCRGAK